MKYRITALLGSTAAALCLAGAAHADAPAAPAAPASWASTIKLTGHVDAGITVAGQQPASDINFGNPFNDRVDELMLNGAALTLERDVDTSAKAPDFGFKVQAVYGTDSRYTQLVGEFNRALSQRETIDIVEAHFDAHLPYLTAGGMEVHAGILPTLEGIEVMDPTGNFFYSHSYLYSFGIPLKYTGIMTETHLNPLVDLYVGIDSGVNTFLGKGGGANDGTVHFHGGLGLNLGPVTVMATTQIGPEDYVNGKVFTSLAPSHSDHNRYLNDINATWKVNDKLTVQGDLNYALDTGFVNADGVTKNVQAYGAFGQAIYTINPILSVGGRAEVWNDQNNFFVGAFAGSSDFLNYEGGYAPLNGAPQFAGGPTTYSEFTLALNVKPQGLPKYIDGMTFRPEVRYDTVVHGGSGIVNGVPTYVFDDQTKKSQFTFAIDVVAPFTVF